MHGLFKRRKTRTHARRLKTMFLKDGGYTRNVKAQKRNFTLAIFKFHLSFALRSSITSLDSWSFFNVMVDDMNNLTFCTKTLLLCSCSLHTTNKIKHGMFHSRLPPSNSFCCFYLKIKALAMTVRQVGK